MSEENNESRKKKNHYWRFRFDCLKEDVRTFFHFLKRLNRFRKLNQLYDKPPEFYRWVIEQYETLMYNCTGGRYSKASWDANRIIWEMWAWIDEHYQLKEEALEEMKKNLE